MSITVLKKRMKKPFYSEIIYFLAIIIISFSVAMLTAADFGVSMIVAPAYIVSQTFTFLTFGQAEYIVQSILLIILCLVLRKFKPIFLMSFATCIIYGLFLDLWRLIIPMFNPNVYAPGSMSLPVRIIFFVLGVVLTSLSVALSFKTYLYPQLYDFFVKSVSNKFNVKLGKFKTAFDLSFLALSLILSFAIFKRLVGVGWGTIVMAFVNGTLISLFSKLFDKFFYAKPLAVKFSKLFEI